jgi:luciferase family oxidoreductase group 1
VIPLSVLDLFPVPSGTAPTVALHDSIALACRVDQLGYHRYWIAEHHNMPGIASSAPEVLIGHVAGVTKRMRIGAGGIMLPNHAPLRVLEIFRTLEALYPGRIDLGIGRAPGTDPFTFQAVRRSPLKHVNEQLAELMGFVRGTFPDDHPYRSLEAMPSDAPVPPIWMLGSSSAGAELAAGLGLGFAFAGHFNMGEAAAAVAHYHANFVPSSSLAEPRLIMAVSVICGESDEHAEALAAPLRVVYARLASGVRAPIPTVEEARAYRFSPEELEVVDRFSRGAIVGGKEKVRARLSQLAEEMVASEIMVSTVVPDVRERIASYERLAEAWGLSAS